MQNPTLTLRSGHPDLAPRSRVISKLWGVENGFAALILLLIAFFPAADVIARVLFKSGVLYSSEYLRHLTLWITFVGALITTRERRHLALSAGIDLIHEPVASWIRWLTSVLAITITTGLTLCSYTFVTTGFDPALKIGIFPIQAVGFVMPAGFALIALRFAANAPGSVWFKLLALCGVGFGLLISLVPVSAMHSIVWPLGIALVLGALFGLPIFALLGGFALLLFHASGGSVASITDQAYAMLTGPMIPTIPLFTLAGFILSESRAGERLVKFFEAWFGWMPGGTVIMAIVVSAFFTTFTGASGVTILALGGLLSIVLIKSNYSRRFSTGLLTACGSIGLLFPPSLPIILYGSVAQINIKHLFVGGILPGILMVIVLSALGIRESFKAKTARIPFGWGRALLALRNASGEIAMPLAILAAFFGGLTTLVESAAFAVVYVLVLEVGIHRDIPLRSLVGVFLKAVPLVGGVLIILSAANGLSYFMIDAEIPSRFAAWCQATIHSPLVFLLLLNLALLLVGCFIDIFSAILVVVPLIIPLGAAFGINPVHLGIIFIANMELGYLTPLVGLNVFLASYRFDEPLLKICRNVIPFQITLFITVLIITYVPWMTTGLLKFFHF